MPAWYVKSSLGAKILLDAFPQTKVTNDVITEVFTAFLKIHFSSLKMISIREFYGKLVFIKGHKRLLHHVNPYYGY